VSLPLEGIRVLDLSRLLPGGFCSLLLADFGAEVLKVEDTGAGDYIRWAPPYYDGAEQSSRSALFLSLNRNKRSIRIDLKQPAGREVLLRLVRDHDVVLESFRPGVLDRLGVGYERMRQENPGIVYCAITGYGQDGPKRDSPGHDMNYLGLVGLLGLTGEPDGPPVQAAGQIADLGGGALMAAFAILAALRERDGAGTGSRSEGGGQPGSAGSRSGSGVGQFVDVSMADGALSWLAMVAGRYFADGVVPHRGEQELAGSLVCYRPYPCEDGWVTLGALEPKFWRAWCRGVGRDDLIDKQFEKPGSLAHKEVQAVFMGRTRAEWSEFAAQHECCLEPVLDLDEALDSELVRARGMVVEIDQPGVGEIDQPGTGEIDQPGAREIDQPGVGGDGAARKSAEPAGRVRQLGVPVKLSRTPGRHDRLPGPALGEHTEEVLRDLGCSPEEIAELLDQGAVAGPNVAEQDAFLA
jgi:crotonobetainyl-CoA:carnitine CoA-transferase CaiB-like acyl-CoA transferase